MGRSRVCLRARTLAELEAEIETLRRLQVLAERVRRSGTVTTSGTGLTEPVVKQGMGLSH